MTEKRTGKVVKPLFWFTVYNKYRLFVRYIIPLVSGCFFIKSKQGILKRTLHSLP